MTGIAIARILGFEIRIHPSWIVILALVGVLVVAQVGEVAPALEPVWAWALGLVVGLAFLGSAIAHELGHAIVARRHGLSPGPVTVYFFGGSASFEPEADDPRIEARIAVAGPLVSLGLGAAILGAGAAALALGGDAGRGVANVALVLGVLNLVLGALNLIPAFPLDGGRLARAALWARSGDPRGSRRLVAAIGRLIGWGLLGASVAVIVLANSIDGIMLAAAGWFLSSAAGQVERRVTIETLLDGLRVGDVMERDLPSIPSQLTVDTFADRLLIKGGDGPALPVIRDERFVGLLSASRVRKLSRPAWKTTRAADVMVAPPELAVLRPDEMLWGALERVRASGLDGLPVVDGAAFEGVLTWRAIAAAIRERRQRAEPS